MALAYLWNLQNLWPFSILKFSDLKSSNELVDKLPIPEHTKQFVFAVQDSETQSVIYILCAQNLSERSKLDVETVIREVRPDAVVAQVGNSSVTELESEEWELQDNANDHVPTSSLGVIKRCFVDKINKEVYEITAANMVLREIFGVSFHGHILAAKRVATEVGSSFLMVESPSVNMTTYDGHSGERDSLKKFQGLVSSSLKVDSTASASSKRFYLTDGIQLRMVKLLSSNMDLPISKLSSVRSGSDLVSKEIQPVYGYEAPTFAQYIYPLFSDLHDIFVDLPSVGSALANAQKMLSDVNRGEVVEARVIAEVCTFRVAIEGLRISQNNAGRLPINKMGNIVSAKTEFSDLPFQDKSHALFTQALRSQTKKFKTIVAVVDASSLGGLRKHWNTHVPPEIKNLVGQLVINSDGDDEVSNHTNRKHLLSCKPVVAVGAGATAILGASSLSKIVPASTLVKVITFNIPSSIKLLLTQTYKAVAVALSKTAGSSKLALSGAKTTTVLKSSLSAERIRVIAHSVVAHAENTSFSAMRTAFYEIMRARRVRPIGFLPWATFGGSVATCTGLLVYGNGIECAAECLPAAPYIACLGRGIQNLHHASQLVRQTDGTRIQKSIESLMYRFKRAKFQ